MQHGIKCCLVLCAPVLETAYRAVLQAEKILVLEATDACKALLLGDRCAANSCVRQALQLLLVKSYNQRPQGLRHV